MNLLKQILKQQKNNKFKKSKVKHLLIQINFKWLSNKMHIENRLLSMSDKIDAKKALLIFIQILDVVQKF